MKWTSCTHLGYFWYTNYKISPEFQSKEKWLCSWLILGYNTYFHIQVLTLVSVQVLRQRVFHKFWNPIPHSMGNFTQPHLDCWCNTWTLLHSWYLLGPNIILGTSLLGYIYVLGGRSSKYNCRVGMVWSCLISQFWFMIYQGCITYYCLIINSRSIVNSEGWPKKLHQLRFWFSPIRSKNA